MSEEVEVMCGEPAGACLCVEPPGHEGPHACGTARCGGVWTGRQGDGSFKIVRWPGGAEW